MRRPARSWMLRWYGVWPQDGGHEQGWGGWAHDGAEPHPSRHGTLDPRRGTLVLNPGVRAHVSKKRRTDPGHVGWTVQIGEATFELETPDTGSGRLRGQLIVSVAGDPRSVATIAQMYPPRRLIRSGLAGTCGGHPVAIRLEPGIGRRLLTFELNGEQWRIQRSFTGNLSIGTDAVLMRCESGTKKIALADHLAPEHKSLCVAIWQSALTESLSWLRVFEYF